MMSKWLGALVLLVASAGAGAKTARSVTYLDACHCAGCSGEERWKVKTDPMQPPPSLTVVKPSEIASWTGPGVAYAAGARVGNERKWYSVTGRVTLMKITPDGDMHVQLVDENAPTTSTNVIVEIPAGEPWCHARASAMELTTLRTPITFHGERKLKVKGKPVITIVGRAFYDGVHADRSKVENVRDNRSKMHQAVWEIHPVMKLTVD